MDNQFWIDKWAKDETGFHLSNPHPLLLKFSSQVFSDSDKIFVPLCGKTHDLRWLAEQYLSVVGSELAEKAVSEFFEEQQLPPRLMGDGDLKAWSASSDSIDITLWQGDFFQLTPAHCGVVSAIYDRAALVALPETLRPRYVQHLKSLVPSANLLLITLDYDQQQMSGPPFSVTPDEVAKLYNGDNIKQLSRKNIIDKEPKFASRGLTEFFETAWHIRW